MNSSIAMVKEFMHHVAWSDSMPCEKGYAGIIGYQHKTLNDGARILWVISPHFRSEYDAAVSADNMLDQIATIDRFGRVIYADGVML
ncbi:MAG: hypothetical protein EOO07_23245 [Chitinophagaceae bacterium]|nr:MAG: hypothetical protein EOO07_23245 [Chitinophagaceae bacterium]